MSSANFCKLKVPSQFRVLQGYLFDVNSKCTPQIDAMIVNSMECHELMASVDGSGYLPFTSVLAVIEIKNTTYNIKRSMTQLASITQVINTMKTEIKRDPRSSKVQLFDHISIMFFADSSNSKPSDFRKYYDDKSNLTPTYTFLLDRGIIIANQNYAHELFGFGKDNELEFSDHLQAGEPFLYIPKNYDQYKAGKALLWLYFSLVAHLNKSQQNQGGILVFTNDAVRKYAIKPLSPLKQLSKWPVENTNN